MAGYLRDLSDWLIMRAEGLEAAGSYERPRPLRFETRWEASLREMSEELAARYLDEILAMKPFEREWSFGVDFAKGSDRVAYMPNRIVSPLEQPNADELRRSLKAYRYDI